MEARKKEWEDLLEKKLLMKLISPLKRDLPLIHLYY